MFNCETTLRNMFLELGRKKKKSYCPMEAHPPAPHYASGMLQVLCADASNKS